MGSPPAPASAPVAPPANYRQYQVQTGNETFWDIARRTLGYGERWGDIHRLNPQFNPREPLPAGAVLRIPER
jgi:nucleoid-associated protein YgaU